MLEPRETELPSLFLVFVVLPLVSYFLLGKWSETSKRKEKISLVGVGAADEALLINNMAVGAVMPVVNLPNMGIHQCARCFCPATTRCSQCKSVRYCSGSCQILHWRQIHKLECQQLWEDFQRYNIRQPNGDTSSEDVIYPPLTSATNSAMTLTTSDKNVLNRRSSEMDSFPEDNGELSKTADGALLKSSDENSRTGFTLPAFSHPSEDTYLQEGDFFVSEGHANENADQTDLIKGEYLSHKRTLCSDEMKSFNCSSERTSMKRNNGIALHKSSKSRAKVSKEPLSSDTNIKAQTANGVASIKNNIPLQESNSVENTGENTGITRMMGMKKSVKIDHRQHLEGSANRQRKIKMIFPYEEFVKCFQFEVLNFTPRGLVNCGNSCYANAVLQCLTYTKPLIIYLLRESHSRAGCTKDWCLVCELEQLVKMLRESGGPLTPVNILVYIRSLNSQIGDGSQEDAHEFLRLLVASMQSISLEIFGGENAVDPAMQNTTFIQHTFGGCLRSKVKCLRCHHESERYESMMDLTLEIFGWVESLEDALTQFTSSENLDGDNMYRCPRCAAYVRAWKQLKIQEAPNILTIVLKRFQEGNYGKINKCITFPEMLDMIPFMTGTDDIPPLYMLYAVVVHLDTSNASFSGHYISYVKDLHGNWFRVDDTEVQPVDLSHVMSEGAYILFYMRSYPRPAESCNKKATGKNSASKSQRSSKPEQSKPNDAFINKEAPLDHRLETINIDYNNISRGILIKENRSSKPSTLEKNYIEEFSDATMSDWSHLTSSDDSSFTTESTRDSFSTEFPFSSIFHSLNYPAGPTSSRTISCSVLPAGSKPLTRFAREEKGFVSMIDLDRRADPAYDGTSDGVHVNYTSNAREEAPQTSFNCTM